MGSTKIGKNRITQERIPVRAMRRQMVGWRRHVALGNLAPDKAFRDKINTEHMHETKNLV